MRLLVISPTAYPPHAEKMLATARRVGIEPMLYGLNSHHPHGKDYQGTDIVKILETRKDAEYVMGVDAPDVAFLAGEEEIMNKFSLFTYPFLMSAEREGVSGLGNAKNELVRQCMADGGYMPHPNIGGWIGRRDYVLDTFNAAERLYKGKEDDPAHPYSYDNHYQWLVMLKAWGGGPEFHIDTKCVIFQSMNYTACLEMDGKRIRNTKTGTVPPILHYHGDPTRGAFNKMVEFILSQVG